MNKIIPWNSQPLDAWAEKYARGKFVELDGLQTHYIEKGEGEPVIVLHGFFFDTHLWDENIDALAERYKVYVPDLWGFGYSTRQRLDYGYALYARQVELFMDALDIPRAHLMGQSFGGGTCIYFAANHPERVNKIVLSDPAVLPNKLPLIGKISNLPGVGEFLFGINNNFMRKMTLGNTFIYRKELITDEFVEKVTRFQKVEGSLDIMLDVLRREFFHTLEEEAYQLGKMELPVLIAAGRQSAGIPIALSQRLHTILPGSRLEIFDKAGHCPNLEFPEKFNQLALEFLSG